MERIKIKYFDDELPRLKKIEDGDWIDLRASEDVSMKQGEFKLIPLGVAMELPEGYEAHVVPRSSTFKNYGIIMTNSVGIIDNSYCGDTDEWKFPAYCLIPKQQFTSGARTVIKKGERICQFRIIKNQPKIAFDEVKHLSDSSRGGFGSTGVE